VNLGLGCTFPLARYFPTSSIVSGSSPTLPSTSDHPFQLSNKANLDPTLHHAPQSHSTAVAPTSPSRPRHISGLNLPISSCGHPVAMAISTMKRNSSRHVYLEKPHVAYILTFWTFSSSSCSMHSNASSVGNVRASCFASSSAGALQGFQYSAGAFGAGWCS
jgi:hypothetical protein